MLNSFQLPVRRATSDAHVLNSFLASDGLRWLRWPQIAPDSLVHSFVPSFVHLPVHTSSSIHSFLPSFVDFMCISFSNSLRSRACSVAFPASHILVPAFSCVFCSISRVSHCGYRIGSREMQYSRCIIFIHLENPISRVRVGFALGNYIGQSQNQATRRVSRGSLRSQVASQVSRG